MSMFTEKYGPRRKIKHKIKNLEKKRSILKAFDGHVENPDEFSDNNLCF